VRLVLLEPQDTRSAAMKRERAIKMMTRERKRRLIDKPKAETRRRRQRIKLPKSSDKA
jgi:predicted GIY-YIG superfamily endonuclease